MLLQKKKTSKTWSFLSERAACLDGDIYRQLKENVYWALDTYSKLCWGNLHALTHLILITDKAGIVKPILYIKKQVQRG